MATSTFINLPPPPSDPVTPSDMGPGTPNSGTTSLSALSTTAIKDGHQGATHHSHSHPPHRHASSTSSNASTTTLDAERADRISRLAGLERIATVRQSAPNTNNPPTTAVPFGSGFGGRVPGQNQGHVQVQGYFDQTGTPIVGKERSTVGSASATGSMGGRTTWASGSGSDVYDGDKMSVGTGPEPEGLAEGEEDDDTSSAGGMSEGENGSLVGFGEGASSTISGPVSTLPGHPPGQQQYQAQMQPGGRIGIGAKGPAPMQGVLQPDKERDRAKHLDGMTYDRNVLDTTARGPLPAAAALSSIGASGTHSNQGTPAPRHAGLSGAETAERIVQERRVKGEDGDVDMGEAGELEGA